MCEENNIHIEQYKHLQRGRVTDDRGRWEERTKSEGVSTWRGKRESLGQEWTELGMNRPVPLLPANSIICRDDRRSVHNYPWVIFCGSSVRIGDALLM